MRSLGAQGGRRFLVKQGHSSAICELDLAGLEDFVTVLSATTDNVALLDSVRERHGDDPFQWLPVLLREVQASQVPNSQGEPHESSSHSSLAMVALALAAATGQRPSSSRATRPSRSCPTARRRSRHLQQPALCSRSRAPQPNRHVSGDGWKMVETKEGLMECTEIYARPTTCRPSTYGSEKRSRVWVVKVGSEWKHCQYPDIAKGCVSIKALPTQLFSKTRSVVMFTWVGSQFDAI